MRKIKKYWKIQPLYGKEFFMNKDKEIYAPRQAAGLNSFASAALPLVRHILGQKGMVAADMLTMWEQIVGEETAAYTFPEKLEFPRGQRNNGVLKLKVPGGAFALEVRHRERFIIEKINSYFGYNAVAGLRIVQDPSACAKMIVHRKQPVEQKSLVSEEEENYINELAGDVADAGLKEKLVSLGRSVFNQNHK